MLMSLMQPDANEDYNYKSAGKQRVARDTAIYCYLLTSNVWPATQRYVALRNI
jgi:hypothetical protein